jgi:hypothetical protein
MSIRLPSFLICIGRFYIENIYRATTRVPPTDECLDAGIISIGKTRSEAAPGGEVFDVLPRALDLVGREIPVRIAYGN